MNSCPPPVLLCSTEGFHYKKTVLIKIFPVIHPFLDEMQTGFSFSFFADWGTEYAGTVGPHWRPWLPVWMIIWASNQSLCCVLIGDFSFSLRAIWSFWCCFFPFSPSPLSVSVSIHRYICSLTSQPAPLTHSALTLIWIRVFACMMCIYFLIFFTQSSIGRVPSYEPGPDQGLFLFKGTFSCHRCLSGVRPWAWSTEREF